MKSHLILVRHSLPAMDFAVPSHAWPLSEEGRRRCGPLADALADYGPVAVASSGEPKARETAEVVAARFGLRVTTEPDLREHDRRGTGRLSREVFQAGVGRLFAEPDALVFGNETGAQARQRFARAIDRIVARHPAGTVVVVSHGTVTSLFVAARAGVDGVALWQQLGLPAYVVLLLPDLTLETVVPAVV